MRHAVQPPYLANAVGENPEADLSIATHHTDGGGVSDHVFALVYLLGFSFTPLTDTPCAS
jgi:TnpA family transposase